MVLAVLEVQAEEAIRLVALVLVLVRAQMATVVIQTLDLIMVQALETGAEEANSLDVKAEVTVSFDEAAFGANKRVRLQGSDGKVQTLEIKIPAGIDTGKTIRLKGKGNVGRKAVQAICYLK